MRPQALIDTGAVLALLDRTDPWHGVCAAAMREMQLPLLTTAAVLTETFHFLRDGQQLVEAWKFYRSGTVMLLPGTEDDLPDLERLMLKYADRPMDFADATLVRLAEREGLSTILTVDRDFEVYRIGGRKTFRVLPKRR
jgi:predicted nucleic acid-binding protein